MSMLDLLECTCNNTDLQVLNPKDWIYAFHGLMNDEGRTALPVDLAFSYQELYTFATQHMLAQYGPSLYEYCSSVSRKRSPALPSWVVD